MDQKVKTPGFFKRMHIKTNILIDKVKTFLKKEDVLAAKDWIMEIVLSGTILNVALLLFGLPISFLSILSLGCLYWFYLHKLETLVNGLISSFCLVKIVR